jgi:hypothetical protein
MASPIVKYRFIAFSFIYMENEARGRTGSRSLKLTAFAVVRRRFELQNWILPADGMIAAVAPERSAHSAGSSFAKLLYLRIH